MCCVDITPVTHAPRAGVVVGFRANEAFLFRVNQSVGRERLRDRDERQMQRTFVREGDSLAEPGKSM